MTSGDQNRDGGPTEYRAAGTRPRVAFAFRYGIADHAELYPMIPRLLRRLAEKFTVYYFGPNRRRFREELKIPGVRYVFVPFAVDRSRMRDKFFKALAWYFCLPWIGLYCRAKRMRLIWIDESALPGQTLLLSLSSGRPVMQTVADFFAEIYAEGSPWLKPFVHISRALDEAGWRRCICLLTHTLACREYLIERGIPPGKTAMIRDAVLPEVFRPVAADHVRRRLGFGPDDVVLCHHGILHPNKGLRRIMEWLPAAMRRDPRIKFLVIGSGPEYNPLQEAAVRGGIAERVVFTGWLPSHEELNQHLNAADVGLVMRAGHYTDHFHVTGALIHSMMAALPVLAVRLKGICEIVTDGREGFLFDPESPPEFQQKLQQLVNDRELRRRMGRSARAKAAQEFDVEKITGDLHRLITRLSDVSVAT